MQGAAFDHPRACRLAQAAEALAELDRFQPWSAGLYEIGEEDLYPALTRIAQAAGLSYGAWASRMTAARTRENIEADISEGLALGLRALPAVYVNGRYLHSLQPREIESVLRAIESGAAP
jgi:protein-disulfide isomerase